MLRYSGGSRPDDLGWDSQILRCKKGRHLLKYQRASAKFVECHRKEVTFCRPKSDCFCSSNYAIFQGITTV